MKFSTKYYLLDEEAMQKLNPQRDKNENSSPILKHFETLLPKENIEKKNLETQALNEFGSTVEPISTIAIDQIEHTDDQLPTSNQKISSEQIIVPSSIVHDKLKKKDQIGKGI